MTEKLRSHLKSEKGFTLIELLVVIAIIAILVVIVLVAINPLARINEANQRDGQSRVRQIAGGVEACLTSRLSISGATAVTAATFCAVTGNLQTGGFLKTVPTLVQVCQGAAATTDDDKVGIYTSSLFGGRAFAYKSEQATTPGANTAGSVFDIGAAVPANCAAVLGG